MGLAKGWDRDSADLFIHDTGARISRTSYRGKLAWWFFPVSLDVPAVEYAPTDEGREEAFATFAREIPVKGSKPKAVPKKKAGKPTEEEGEPGLGSDTSEKEEPDDEDGEAEGN